MLVFWAISVALTRKTCEPSAKPKAVNGELQPAKTPPSSWQLTLAPGSLEVKSNKGSGSDRIEPSAGPAEIVTVGAVVSTVKDRVRTALSFPGASIALTLKVCGPSGAAGRDELRAAGDQLWVEAAFEGRAGFARGKLESRGRVVDEASVAGPRRCAPPAGWSRP